MVGESAFKPPCHGMIYHRFISLLTAAVALSADLKRAQEFLCSSATQGDFYQ